MIIVIKVYGQFTGPVGVHCHPNGDVECRDFRVRFSYLQHWNISGMARLLLINDDDGGGD